jgi:hypothetical protein
MKNTIAYLFIMLLMLGGILLAVDATEWTQDKLQERFKLQYEIINLR